jgi:hypothetical protein
MYENEEPRLEIFFTNMESALLGRFNQSAGVENTAYFLTVNAEKDPLDKFLPALIHVAQTQGGVDFSKDFDTVLGQLHSAVRQVADKMIAHDEPIPTMSLFLGQNPGTIAQEEKTLEAAL